MVSKARVVGPLWDLCGTFVGLSGPRAMGMQPVKRGMDGQDRDWWANVVPVWRDGGAGYGGGGV